MIVRDAEPRDAAALTALVKALNAQQGDPTDRITEARVRADLIGGGAGGRCVVAERDGALIGYATGFPTYESGFAARGMYVGDLFVAEPARRQGVARALLAALGRGVLEGGGDHLWLTAKPWNAAAHALYRRLGASGEEVVAFAVAEHNLERLVRA
ncbi:MAG: GNAT family N-acetyltransferase [Acetobacteraceae bacterium]